MNKNKIRNKISEINLSWPKEDKYDQVVKYLLFLIWPLAGFIFSLRRLKSKSSHLVIFLFGLLYAFSFKVPFGSTLDMAMDAARYRVKFARYFGSSQYQYFQGLEDFFSFEGERDYYFDTLAFFVSRFTENYHAMFLVVGLVFAYFAMKSFRFLTSEEKFRFSIACFILAYLFMFKQIFSINGVRFWTAYWIAVYSIFQIHVNKKERFYILALVTPFVHAGYWLFLVILLLGRYFRRFEKVWVILFFISFAVSSVVVEVIQYSIDSLPPVLAQFAERKIDPEKFIEERGVVQRSFKTGVRVLINIMVILFIRNSKEIKANLKTKNLYLFLLIWMTFANFTMPAPSLGSRFIQLSYPLIAYIWLVNFYKVKYIKFVYIIPVVFLFDIFIQTRRYFSVLPNEFFISNAFSLILKNL